MLFFFVRFRGCCTAPLQIPVLIIGSISLVLNLIALLVEVVYVVAGYRVQNDKDYNMPPYYDWSIEVVGSVTSALLILAAIKRQRFLLVPYLFYALFFLMWVIFRLTILNVEEVHSGSSLGVIISVILIIEWHIVVIVYKHFQELAENCDFPNDDEDVPYGKMTNDIA